jgi:hypothetical protein
MRATGEFIAGVVEVDDFFQALKVAIVHIGLHEIGTRPLVNVSQGRHLELAVELRSEPRPLGIRVELRISEEVAYLSFAKTSSAFSFNNLGKPDITC